MMRIPIKGLKEFAIKYKLTSVIVYADDGKQRHIATYGSTIEKCSQAADVGNKLKKVLRWPESLQSQPSRVKKLQKRIEELEGKLEAMEETLS